MALTSMVIVLLSACVSAHERDLTIEQKLARQNYRMLEEVERIQDSRINGWYYVDDYNLIFQAGPSRYYLLTFNQMCLNLRGAHTIAFSTAVGRVTRFDKVLVRDPTGLPAERCQIEEMHRLEKLS